MTELDLKGFLLSPLRNAWIKEPNLKVYVRKGHHAINGAMASTFDIGSVMVEKQKGRGTFWRFTEYLQRELDPAVFQYLYVESVLNERLADSLRTHGWIEIPESAPPCFIYQLRKVH